MTTVNETASVIFSSGSNRFGDFGDDIHSFTGSVQITGSFTLVGSSTATSYNGIINATNGVVSGSSQVVSILSSLNTYTGSQDTKNSTLATYTASLDTKNSTLAIYTASLETKNLTLATYTASLETKNLTLATYTASLETKNLTLATYTASLETKNLTLATYTSSVDTKFTSVGISTASLNTYTSSLKSALQLTGSNVVVLGDLTVLGTTSTANSTTLNVSDKFITLASGSTTSALANGAGFRIAGANVTMSWDSTNSQLKFNTDISASKFYGDGTGLTFNGSGIVSSSVQTIANLPTGTVSGSSQVVGILSSLNTYTGSNDTTNTTQNTRLSRIEESTASINLITSSLATTYEGRATAAKTIFSGSSQVVGSAITTNTITIGSTSTALGGTATTIAGLTSVTSTGFTGALTGNASTATTLANARTINGTSFNGSTDITIANLVSGSAQVTMASTTGFGTYINQAVLTTSTPTFAKVTTPKIAFERSANTAHGISWYNISTYTAWCDYMANGGATSQGPTGNITASTGTYVTSWARRFFVEDANTYGWIFEKGAVAGTSPTVVAELRSSDGLFSTAGEIYSAGSLVKTSANSSYSTTFTSVSSVSVTHSLGTKNVMVMCYDSADEMFWPATIKTTSTSVVDITFTVARTGRVVIIR